MSRNRWCWRWTLDYDELWLITVAESSFRGKVQRHCSISGNSLVCVGMLRDDLLDINTARPSSNNLSTPFEIPSLSFLVPNNHSFNACPHRPPCVGRLHCHGFCPGRSPRYAHHHYLSLPSSIKTTFAPACAVACLRAADLRGCVNTDSACLCRNEAFVVETTQCFIATCPPADVEISLQAGRALCAAVVRPGTCTSIYVV